MRRLVAGPREAVRELVDMAVELGQGAAVVVLDGPDGSLRVAAHGAAVEADALRQILGSLELTLDDRAGFVAAHPDLPLDRLPGAWAIWARANQPLRSLALPLACGDRVFGWLWVGAVIGREQLDQLRDLTAVAALRHAQEVAARATVNDEVEFAARMSAQIDAVEVANQAVDWVGARVHHDVRDVAREVLAWARVGTEVDLEPELRAELLMKIRRSAERLGGILGDVMEDLEEVKSDRRDAITVDLNGPVGWVRGVLAEQFEERHAELVVDPLPTVMATSPTLLRGVLLELVRNAVEHGGHGVRVKIGVGRLDSVVELVVEDNGPGIPEQDRDAMFAPGYTTGRGVGLGLARVRHGVASMGGTVVARESASGGVAVHVVLPRQGATTAVPRLHPSAPTGD